jgi:hypothetical protein
MIDVNISVVPLSLATTKGYCNTNNHLPHEVEEFGEEPIDEIGYWTEYQKTVFETWFPLKQKLSTTKTQLDQVALNKQHLQNILEISKSSILTGRLPRLFEDECNEIVELIKTQISFHQPYFVKTKSASMKDGLHGTGPFMDAKQVLEAICTSKKLQNIIKKELQFHGLIKFPLYFVPWNPSIKEENEFRCFVNQWKVTAISQYVWSKNLGWSNRKDELVVIAEQTVDLLEKLKQSGGEQTLPSNFIMDVYFDGCVELLELNCYGAQMAGGSCCFHWLRDYHLLHGNGKCIEFKIVGSE